jgi:cholesterol transport system auxiliary component
MHIFKPLTIKSIATKPNHFFSNRNPLAPCTTHRLQASALAACLALALAGCATPQSPVAKAVYDFGPTQASNTAVNTTPSVAIALADVEAHASLEGAAVVYRLGYADVQQLRPYTLARWSAPPAQLVRQRLRDALSARGAVLAPVDGGATWLLKVELEEFSQLFDTPSSSQGVVRLRATLMNANKLVAQRNVSASAAAPSADAAGGVRGLTLATDDAVRQINAWVQQQMR